MGPREAVAEFLKRKSWRLVQHIDLGTTAHVFVVERGNERCVLKIRRDEDADTSVLLAEYRVLRYLTGTSMQRYIPRVGDWLPELDGFLIEYLRYPTRAERADQVWVPNLARALQTLHSVDLAPIQGLADDRPSVGTAISRRFRDLFKVVLRTDGFWTGLLKEDEPKLERLRACYHDYVGLLSQMADSLAHAQVALTHGDLAGDNIMLAQDGRLAIVDWGSARISAALTDVASLSTYADWSQGERHQFHRAYLSDTSGSHEEALQCLEVLRCLYRYRSCVKSLLWLNDEREGLDAVGRAHFERQLREL
jgi:aminoglycoside phosphotransferase (APT) family kinase protein